MSSADLRKNSSPTARDAGLVLGAIAVICHVVANVVSPYGWHRDEFLYFAMGDHLRLWRMDFPPMIAILANVSRGVFGESLAATRIFPALSHGVLIWLTARMARALGGSRFAEWLAALVVFASPIFMRPGTLFQPVVFDQLWWTLALFCLMKVGLDDNPRWWIGVGASLGFGLLTKFSIAFIAIPIVLGIIVAPLRRWLATPWPWAAAGIALIIGLPSITGQLLLGFPVVGQMHDLEMTQLTHVTPVNFLTSQLLFSPIFVPLSIWGLIELYRRPTTRAVAVACAGAQVLLMALRGKSYYAGPVYPTLFAATAVCVAQLKNEKAPRLVRVAVVSAVVIVGAAIAPFGYPVIPPAPMARYAATLGITQAVRTNTGTVLELPQDYADMLGWEEMVRQVAQVYHALPAAEQARAVIFGQNYGRAGAIDFFAEKYQIPRSVSGTGSYWFFGPGDRPGEILISVGSDHEDLDRFYESVEAVAQTSNPHGVPEERSFTIWLCRRPRDGMTLQTLWPSLAGDN